MAAMLVALDHGILAAMPLFPVGSTLPARLLVFQHDCGHGSFFASRWANNLLGWALGVLTPDALLAVGRGSPQHIIIPVPQRKPYQ
jgi:fatty acid desaturase